MRLLMLFLLLMSSSLYAIGDVKINNRVELSNGDTVPSNHVFELDDVPKFSLTKNGECALWSFAVWRDIIYDSGPQERRQKKLESVYSSLGVDSLFTVPLSSIKYGDHLCKYPKDSIRVFKGVIFASFWDGTVDSVEVELNFLPAIPKVYDVSLTYEYDWIWDTFNEGYMEFTAVSKRAKKFGMKLINSYRNSYDIPEDNGEYMLILEGDMKCLKVINRDSRVFKLNNCDWGQAYKIFAYNDFGTTFNDEDILFTTDYIHDPLVLARIDSLKKAETSDIHEINQNDGIKVFVNKNVVSFINKQNISKVIVFDSAGNVCWTQKTGSSIELHFWPSGLYIIRVYGNENEFLTTKIVK